jgi:endoglucanase
MYAYQRRTYTINASHPGTEIWASASAALASADLLLRGEMESYAEQLRRVAVALFDCATLHNLQNNNLDDALPEVSPQYVSWGFTDELGWAAAWLYDATRDERYADAFKVC